MSEDVIKNKFNKSRMYTFILILILGILFSTVVVATKIGSNFFLMWFISIVLILVFVFFEKKKQDELKEFL